MSGAKRQKIAHDAPAKRQQAEASTSKASPDPPTEEESATLDVASSGDAADAPEEPKTFKELVRDKMWRIECCNKRHSRLTRFVPFSRVLSIHYAKPASL